MVIRKSKIESVERLFHLQIIIHADEHADGLLSGEPVVHSKGSTPLVDEALASLGPKSHEALGREGIFKTAIGPLIDGLQLVAPAPFGIDTIVARAFIAIGKHHSGSVRKLETAHILIV